MDQAEEAFDRIDAAKAEKAKIFDIKLLKTQKGTVETMLSNGMVARWRPLNWKSYSVIVRAETDADMQTAKMIEAALKPENPDITLEDVLDLKPGIFAELTSAILIEMGFTIPTPTTSPPGSLPRPKRRS